MIETPLRPEIPLERDWEFVRRRVGRGWLAGEGDGGVPVELPHCWNESDTYQWDRTSDAGWAAYRRNIARELSDLPAGYLRVLRAGGFYGVGDVRLDGRRLARFDAQYLGFTVALPASAGDGGGWLGIRVDNRPRRDVLPATPEPDFLLHGGLAGGLRLEAIPEPSIDRDSLAVDSRRDGDDELVKFACTVAGRRLGVVEAEVRWAILDAGGERIAESEPRALPLAARTRVESSSGVLRVGRPRCWSPDDPQLYWAEATLAVDGVAVDVVRWRFGIPRIELRPREGLFLDGRRVELRGANRHESIPGLGSALPASLQRRDAESLKWLGCNFVRLSHYPQSPEFLDACDELGLLVYAEVASWKSVRSSRRFRRAALRQLGGMLLRDRHRPSLLCWGMGNESRSRRAYLEMSALVERLDPRRPTTYAENHLYRARRLRVPGIPDVWSVNYELDVLDEGAAASRLGLVLASECCNHPASRRGDDREELTQIYTLERDWEALGAAPHRLGYAVWSLTDYATEHRGRVRRLAGLLDAWRTPKMAAELFRARHADAPCLALYVTAPGPERPPSRFRRDLDRESSERAPRELHVFTNCDPVELRIGDAPALELEGALHYVLGVGEAPIAIAARGRRSGRVARAELAPHGVAARVALEVERATLAPGSTIEIGVAVVDEGGRRARDWNGEVRLAAAGAARLRAFTPDGATELARGVGRSYLTAGVETGEATVTAHAPGLASGRLALRVG